jgi:hypothetical protein
MFRKGTFWVAFFLSLAISFCPAAKAGDNDQKEIKKIASAATHISKIKQVNVEILGNTAWVAVLGKILSKEVVAKPPLEFDVLQDLVMTKTGDKWQIVAKNVDLLDFKEEPFYKDMPEVAKQAFEKFLYRATMMGTWIYFPTDTYEGRFIFLPDGTFTFTGWESPKFKSWGTWQAGRDSVKLTFLDNKEYWKKTFSFPSGKMKEWFPNIRSFDPKTLTVEFEIKRHDRYHFINFLGWIFIKINK